MRSQSPLNVAARTDQSLSYTWVDASMAVDRLEEFAKDPAVGFEDGRSPMSNRRPTSAKLQHALETPCLYKISRRSKAMGSITGFVVGVGKKWVLIACTAEGGYPDGLTAIRARDVSDLQRDRSFETRFALTQPQRELAELAKINLDRTADLLTSLSALSRLLAVEREWDRPGLWVGEYRGSSGKRFWLSEVRSTATWYPQEFAYRLKSATTVSIDSRYLKALAAIAGESPSDTD